MNKLIKQNIIIFIIKSSVIYLILCIFYIINYRKIEILQFYSEFSAFFQVYSAQASTSVSPSS